jgi:carbon-monoxide dehydrogenase large subunit
MLARQIKLIYDTGAYAIWGARVLDKGAVLSPGPYRIPNIRVDGCVVHTNKVFGGAMRGHGAPQVTFAEEVHTDHVALRLGVDPIELRLKNAFQSGAVEG